MLTGDNETASDEVAKAINLDEYYCNLLPEEKLSHLEEIKGEYGKAPGKIDPSLIKKVLGDEKPIEGRYADTLGDGYEAAKAEIGSKAHSEEDVLSYIAFPTQAEAFFDKRDERKKNTFTYTIKKID